MRPLIVLDTFCGAGGETTGIYQAAAEIGRKVDLTAINHWAPAVATHSANYPQARHECQDIRMVDILDLYPNRHVDLMWTTPECKNYSKAAGRRPKKNQNRVTPYDILRYIDVLLIDTILFENVPEIRQWGPEDALGRPIKSKRGLLWNGFVQQIKDRHYTVDVRVLNAADYGAATSRSRLFLMAKKGLGKMMVWPEPSHHKRGIDLPRWPAARGVIDWSNKGRDITDPSEKGVALNTWTRIWEGIRRFGGPTMQPFLVQIDQTGRKGPGVRSVESPCYTFTTKENLGLIQPEAFMLSQASGGAPRHTDSPMPTIVGEGRGNMLIQPEVDFIVPNFGEDQGQSPRVHSVESPMPTVTATKGAGNLVRAELSMVLPTQGYFHREGQNAAKSLDAPLGGITQRGGGSVVRAESFLIKYNRTGGARSTKRPLDTLTGRDRYGLCTPEPYVVRFNGTDESHIKGSARSIDAPLDTIVASSGHLGLVIPTVDGERRLRIYFRMLQPDELAKAMGFPSSYQFKGKKSEVVMQIGNAVSAPVAKALTLAVLAPKSKQGRLSD